MNQFVTFALLSVLVAGIVTAISPNDDLSRELGEFVVREMGSGNELIKVVKIQTQVVNGMNYHMTIKVKTFRLGGIGHKVRTCKVVVWSQGLSRQVTSNTCN